MTITAFLEAAKKATGGEWGYDRHHTVAVIETSHEWGESIAQLPSGVGANFTQQDKDNMEFIASARNAAKEIEELVNLCRKITDRGKTVSTEDVDRIREIVK